MGRSIYDFGNQIFGIFSCKFANAEGVGDNDDVLDNGVLVVSFLDNDILRARYFCMIFDVDKSGVIDVDDCVLPEEACDNGVLLEEACDDGVLVVSFLKVVILCARYFYMIFSDNELVEVRTCFSFPSISEKMRWKGPFEMFVHWGAEGSESSLIFLLVLFFVFFDIFLKKFGKIIRNTR